MGNGDGSHFGTRSRNDVNGRTHSKIAPLKGDRSHGLTAGFRRRKKDSRPLFLSAVQRAAFVLAILLGSVLVRPHPTADSGQVLPAGGARVVYGHHHLNVTSIEAHRKFWVDGLGGVEATLDGLPTTIIRFPNVLVLLRQQPPKGDMTASVVPRLGFDVASLAAATDRLKAVGYSVITSGSPAAGTVVGPDGLELELVEDRSALQAIALRDVQFSVKDPDAVIAWYARMFGAAVSPSRKPLTATLPGLTMLFRSATVRPVGTQSGALDHIGLEVEHLEAFCAELQRKGVSFNRPYTKLPA
jgi:hypothetical protein